jgi:hypothetical protein
MQGQTQLDLKDFSGGITDEVIGRSINLSARLHNLQVKIDLGIQVRPGSLADGETDTLNKLTSGVELLAPAITAGDKPFKFSTGSNKGKLFSFVSTAHVELVGPSGNSLFTSAHGPVTDHQFGTTRWNDHLFITSQSMTQKAKKAYVDTAGVLSLRNASLPKYDGTPTFTNSGTGGSYLYAFVWKHTYTSGARTFIDRSAPFFHPTARTFIASSISCTVGALTNSGGENYYAQAAGANESMVLEVYRTTNAGSIFYLAGSADYLSPTVVTDGVTDANLVLNQTLYTTSGVVARDELPICKFFHITDRGIGICAYIKDGNDILKNRVGQSIPGVPGCRPGTFFDDADDEITGVSSHKGVPIIFGVNNIYRGEGQIEATGQGQFRLKNIIDGVGCINHNSIIQTFAGVFFAGQSGFYWTDGFNVKKISDEINTTFTTAYSTAARKRACVAAFDEADLKVFWTFTDTSTSDGIFVFHLRFGIKERGVFTTWGGQTNTVPTETGMWPTTVPTTITQNFRAKCLLYTNGALYRGDDRGYTFVFSSATKTDPRVVTSDNVSAWGKTYIFYDWRSILIDYGTSLIRKWTTSVMAVFRNRGDISVSAQTDRDQEGQFKICREMKVRSTVTWGEDGILWGDPVLWASESALFLENRRFPARKLRCTYRQMRMTNAFTVIQKSDSMGLATFATTGPTRTVELLTGSWPVDVLDYYISHEVDGYEDKFLVTARSATTLTVSDPNARFPANGNYKWELKGYAKGHVIDVQAVSLPYMLLTDESQTQYRSGTEAGNA